MSAQKKKIEQEQLRKLVFQVSPTTSAAEYIHSSLFHDVYLSNDLKNDFPAFWGRTGIAEEGFGFFIQGLKEISLKFKSLDFQNLNHTETTRQLIDPVLAALGWEEQSERIASKIILVTNKQGDDISIKPSYLLFADPTAAKAFAAHYNNSTKPVQANVVPISTSYFGSWSDRRAGTFKPEREQIGRYGDLFSSLGTDEQAFNYLELVNAEWGFSTDGHSWRLIKKSAYLEDHNKYFEFNLFSFLNSLSTAKPHEEDQLLEVAKHFYWFFSKESHQISRPNRISMTWERSRKYTSNLEDDLRARFVAAVSLAVNSLWDMSKNKKIEIGIESVQQVAESLIFNILFIRSCESRRILPLHQSYIPVSLHNIVSKLRDFRFTESKLNESTTTRLNQLFEKKINEDGFEIFDYLLNLFSLTNDSDRKSQFFGFAIEGFKENILTESEWALLKRIKIDNFVSSKLLSTLFYLDQNVQIPFNIITPQQFGSIFESFLEFKLSKVANTQYLLKRKTKVGTDIIWTDKTKPSDQVMYTAKRGSLYFRSDNTDRKISGSYYTPDHVVDYMVEQTLCPLVEGKTAEEILSIRVCDPAMGSGHFLISALRYLTSAYAKRIGSQQDSIASTKRKILHNCIFGVDINGRAIKLGKLALWLETAEAGKVLEHLDDQLKCTNSLTDSNLWGAGSKFVKHGIDAVIGNPPYIDSETMVATQPKTRDQIASTYKTAKGNWDLYVPFFELSVKISKPNARIALIVPNKWLAIDYGIELRKFAGPITDKIIDCSNVKIFADAGNNPLIWIADKDKNSGEILIQKMAPDLNLSVPHSFSLKQIASNWGLLLVDNPKLISKISKHSERVASKFQVESPFTVSEAYEIKKILEDGTFNSKLHFKFINTGTIDPFESLWNKKNTTYIKAKYKSPIVSRSILKQAMPKRFEQSQTPKIVISGMRYFECYLDSLGEYVAGKSTVMIKCDSKPASLVALNGYLNSNLVSYYLKQLFKSQGIDGGVSFTPNIVREIPIVDSLLCDVNFKNSSKLASDAIASGNKAKFDEHFKKINDAVYEAFDLTKGEIESIEIQSIDRFNAIDEHDEVA